VIKKDREKEREKTFLVAFIRHKKVTEKFKSLPSNHRGIINRYGGSTKMDLTFYRKISPENRPLIHRHPQGETGRGAATNVTSQERVRHSR